MSFYYSTIRTAQLMMILTLISISYIRVGETRELRPSEHGLTYQTPYLPSDSNSSQTAAEFFGSEDISIISSSKATPPSSNSHAKLPPPTATTDGSKQERRDRKLEVAAIACGGSGFVLLLAGALVLALHGKKSGESTQPPTYKSQSSAAVARVD